MAVEAEIPLRSREPDENGVVGVAAGAIATAVYASTKHWTIVVPTTAWAGGLAAAFLIGAVAGLLPAIRAARMSPTEALRTI